MLKSGYSEPKEYSITVCCKVPITIYYNGRGVVPVRTIAYRQVKRIRITENVSFGMINYADQRIAVKRTRADSCSPWSQWEVVKMIDPMAYTPKLLGLGL